MVMNPQEIFVWLNMGALVTMTVIAVDNWLYTRKTRKCSCGKAQA